MQPSVDLPYLTRNVKGKQYAYTRLPDGSRPSLGRAGTPESWRRLADIHRRLGYQEPSPDDLPPLTEQLTVAELAEQYLRHRQAEYEAQRLSRTTLLLNRCVVHTLIKRHGHLLTSEFGPRALGAIQTRLASTPCQTSTGRYRGVAEPPLLSRSEVNRRVTGIRSIMRWGVARELVPPAVLTALEAVREVRRGDARETPKRHAVPIDQVEAVIAELRRDGNGLSASQPLRASRDLAVADALEFMRWTGCRPGEACSLRMSDLLLDHEPPQVILQDHKTAKSTGSPRVIPLNPKALESIRAAQTRVATEKQDSPVFGYVSTRKLRALRSNGLYQTVTRVCLSTGIPRWSPYQIRHTVASAVIAATGSEVAAAALLGHSKDSKVVRRYSQDRIQQASRGADSLLS